MLIKRIINPWVKMEGGNSCFACSTSVPGGLRMQFYLDGDEVVCYWKPDEQHSSWPGIVHGGVQTTLMDELGMWGVNMLLETAGFTRNLNVKYIKNVNTTKTVEVRAKIREVNRMFAFVDAWIIQDGKKCTEADIKYFIVSKEAAAKDFYFSPLETEDCEIEID